MTGGVRRQARKRGNRSGPQLPSSSDRPRVMGALPRRSVRVDIEHNERGPDILARMAVDLADDDAGERPVLCCAGRRSGIPRSAFPEPGSGNVTYTCPRCGQSFPKLYNGAQYLPPTAP